MSETYLTSPISLYDFRDWKWLHENKLRISYDKGHFDGHGFFDDMFILWETDVHSPKKIQVYVKSGFVIGFRWGGTSANYELIKLIESQFEVEIANVGYILEKYEDIRKIYDAH